MGTGPVMIAGPIVYVIEGVGQRMHILVDQFGKAGCISFDTTRLPRHYDSPASS
jgi:hypothetical protein